MRVAVIDIGANTIRLQVYEVFHNQAETIFTKKVTAGLVTYIDNGQLSERGLARLISILSTHMRTIKLFKVRQTIAFATASLRNISNLDYVKRTIKEKAKTDLVILSQEEEAQLGYLGISHFTQMTEGFTVDIGGGSTEIVRFKNNSANVFLNLNFGCLSLYEDYVNLILPAKDEIKKMNAHVNDCIKAHEKINVERIIGIGGTMRAAGNIISEFLPNHSNTLFSYDDLMHLYKGLTAQDHKLFKIVLQVSPERVHTITPGIIIIKNILEIFHAASVQVSNTGLREGVLFGKIMA